MFKFLENPPPKWVEHLAVYAGLLAIFIIITLAGIGGGVVLAMKT